MTQLEHAHHQQDEGHVLREVAVGADAPQQERIAAVAQARAVAAQFHDPEAQHEKQDGENSA